MRQESAALQESGNLEVDRKLPSTLQTQHQLRACTLAGSVAKNKVQTEARKKKQEEEEEEEEEGYLLRRNKGGFTTSSPSFLTKIVDHIAYRRNRIPEEQLSVEEAASNRSRSQFL
jgi:hypothetical protein